MPYQVTWEPRGVYTRYWGNVTGADMLGNIEDVCRDERFELHRYHILDFSDATDFVATEREMLINCGVLVTGPLPSNAFISHNGFDWAWANPWPHDEPLAEFDLSVQAAYGWRIPNVAELALAPQAIQFMFHGANVPLGGVDPVSGAVFQAVQPSLTDDAACATPYFSTRNWCDWQDGRGRELGWDWYGSPANGQGPPYDTIVIRNRVVPEPASLALLGLGLAGLGLSRRRTST